MSTITTGARRSETPQGADVPGPDHGGRAALAESLATGAALAACVAGRFPHRLLVASGTHGWVLSLVVVVTGVNGARALARAPFTLHRFRREHPDRPALLPWARAEGKAFFATVVVGTALTLPLYALLRATPAWWLLAWVVFAAVTVGGAMAGPLLLRAQSGPLLPAPGPLADRVRALGVLAGVDIGDRSAGAVPVAVAGPAAGSGKVRGRRCNAYVVGVGPTRRVVLEPAVAAWPPELVDQVVAHEIGHWRLGHGARRLPLTILAQLGTFALAAWLLGQSSLLAGVGSTGAGDPRSYPFLLLVTPLLALPARCLLAWRDRAQERAADEFALSLLGAPQLFTAMLDRAADEGGAPRHLPWWRRLTASHPPIDERALSCTRFASIA